MDGKLPIIGGSDMFLFYYDARGNYLYQMENLRAHHSLHNPKLVFVVGGCV